MLTAFTTALSALNANSTAVSVVGNNLANLNTPGYKANSVYFRDLVSSGGGGRGAHVFGTAPPTAIPEFTQGAIQASSGPLDAAIQGDGFFVVRNSSGATLFTRAGNFQTNGAGMLTTATGELVQGWNVDPTTGQLNTKGPAGPINVPVGTLKPPVATTNIALDLNLNASAEDGATDLSYPVQVFDDQGSEHTLTIDFTKTGPNEWSYTISIPAADVQSGSDATKTAGGAPILATGQLAFNANGTLKTPDAKSPVEFTVANLTDQADSLNLTWNLYSSAGTPTITQYAETSTVSACTQNGSGPAQLTGVSLGNGGTIIATYSDDQKQVVGQLALASIRNPDSLTPRGDNNYTIGADTAVPVIGLPGAGGRGNIVGGSIESSTVDIATEFTNLIVYQNAYQANSRVVTSANEICQSTISLIH